MPPIVAAILQFPMTRQLFVPNQLIDLLRPSQETDGAAAQNIAKRPLFLCSCARGVAPPPLYLIPARSPYSGVSQPPCHHNELDLSPSVQTTIDERRGPSRENKSPPLAAAGGMVVYVSAHMCARVADVAEGSDEGRGPCHRGTLGRLLTCHPRLSARRARHPDE